MKNVLFLSIDDLNDWTNALGGYAGTVHTPHLDALMSQGTAFTNAFSQAAICNPSRASILTGLEPQNTGIFNNQKHSWEHDVAASDTIFGVFKDAGYFSKGVGKLFHTGATPLATEAMFDDYQYMGKDQTGVNINGKPAGAYTGTDQLADEKRTEHIVEYLENYVPTPGEPLFLSVGLLKPHTDWVVPQEFFDLYPLSGIQLDNVAGDRLDIPAFALDNVGQIYPWSGSDVSGDAEAKLLVQAYLATISFMDAQVGKIMDALANSAIGGNTMTVLWSDHGYHLGDKDFWHKFTLWDNAARAPLIFHDPGTIPAGVEVDDAVELLDIFPTVMDMAGVTDPSLSLDGKSLKPYFNGSAPAGTPEAYTWMYGNVSIRTNEYRYSVYEDGSVELYDVVNDPELLTNLAGNPAHATAQADLAAKLVTKFDLVGYGDTATHLTGIATDNVFADTRDNVTLEGNDGDDVYFIKPTATVIETATGGSDMIITEGTNYTLPDFIEDLEMKVFSNTVNGNALDNMIVANAWVINAGAGNDYVLGGNRAGTYSLGTGNDEIFGGSGADTIYGEQGNDTLRGDAGNDRLDGALGNDRLFGGAGNDLLSGATGDDHLDGGVFEDNMFGGQGNDVLYGGAGLDTLYGGAHNDTMYGGQQKDTLHGEWGNDVLSGGDGADVLNGNQNDDWLFGDAGNDTLDGGSGADNLHGGIGNDTLTGSTGADTLKGEWGNDVLSGGDGNDALHGDQFEDWLFGGSGSDTLEGGVGFDNLNGGAGNDSIYGGDQADTLRGEWGNDVLSGGSGNDLLLGEQFEDWLFGGIGNDTLEGGVGFDNLYTGAGNDFAYGGDQRDSLYGEWGDDVLDGGAGDDQLYGQQNDDWIFASTGNDVLFGGAGVDNLFGSFGNDTLDGGTGNDRLTGEAGDDVFVFTDGFGTDTVADFDATNALEKIDLSGVSGILDWVDLSANHLSVSGADVVITDGVHSVTLINVTLGDLDATDFLF